MILWRLFICFLALATFGAFSDASAQQPQVTQQENKPQKKREVKPEDITSLFFTYWQYQSIQDSKSVRGVIRPPTEAELAAIERGDDIKPKASERYLSLAGIVYTNEDDWTIWFNSKRITPDAVPPEVLDLKVHEEYIELKWFDDYTNQVFPIRLRAHQRFHMDQRIFLPG